MQQTVQEAIDAWRDVATVPEMRGSSARGYAGTSPAVQLACSPAA